MIRIAVLVFGALCLSIGAQAQWGTPGGTPGGTTAPSPAKSPASVATISLKDVDALRQAVTDAEEKMPLTVRRAIFVTEAAPVIGAWTERPSNVFKAGEDIRTYVEPVGYTWKPRGDMFDFGVNVDFVVKSANGKILGGQENFSHVMFSNHMKIQELMLNLRLSPDGFPPGQYVVEYKLHDQGSDKVTSVALPFTVAE
jgi:hypothetical protein